MAKQLFANNASALLAASIDDDDLTIQVASGFGALFPNPGADEFFEVTLENAGGDIEIVKIESRSTDLLTVASGGRGQGGTSAQSWTNGVTRVEARLTKGAMDRFIQREGDTMSGDLDMDGNEVQDADLTGSGTKLRGGQIINVPLRGVEDDASNEIAVPTDGTRATAGGSKILVEGDEQMVREAAFEVGMLMQWYGAAAECPDGWAICDGTNGTPDMRNRFAVGAGDTYALDDEGGAATASGNTGSSGAHDHGGAAGNTTLTLSQIPAHSHKVMRDTSVSSDVWSNDSHAVAGESSAGGDTEYDLAPVNFGTWRGGSESQGGGQAHNHSISSAGAHTHTLDSISTLPPYKAVYWIMFVGY
jgi:microcystin-dependent protein